MMNSIEQDSFLNIQTKNIILGHNEATVSTRTSIVMINIEYFGEFVLSKHNCFHIVDFAYYT
jgi:hypothetical protein